MLPFCGNCRVLNILKTLRQAVTTKRKGPMMKAKRDRIILTKKEEAISVMNILVLSNLGAVDLNPMTFDKRMNAQYAYFFCSRRYYICFILL